MKLLYCWSDISGYMAACWRELAASSTIDLFVIAFQAGTETDFSSNIMKGIPHRLLSLKERDEKTLVKKLVLEQQADKIILAGWFHPPYKNLVFQSELNSIEFILAMDTPYWGKLRQKLAQIALWPFLKKISKVIVSGERSWQYARRLGFSHERILKGQYGIDFPFFESLAQERSLSPWPKNFLFIGRYSSVKAIDILVLAYEKYRQQSVAPWNLFCCGKGVLENLLDKKEGIKNFGFVQPDQLSKIFVNSGAFIMPSRFDPWPLSIVEACAAGLPVICTSICGTSVELIKSEHNGFVIPENNIDALVQAMLKIEMLYEDLPSFGLHAVQQARPYSAKNWAKRLTSFLGLKKNRTQLRSGQIITSRFTQIAQNMKHET